MLFKKRTISFSHGSLALLIMLFVFLISYVWAINRSVVLSRFVSIANTFLLYLFIIQFHYDEKSIEMIENASLLGAVILVVWVFTNINLGLVYAGYRLRFSQLGSEYFSDPNGLAGRLMFPLIISINRALFGKKKLFIILYGAIIAALSYILLLTGSRAGVIAIAAAVVALLFQGLEKKKIWILAGFTLLLLLFYFAPRFLPEHISQRVFNINKYKEITSIKGDRIDIWKHVVIDLFLWSPLFGYGGGCSGNALAQFYGHVKAVHNSYLMVLCEVGLLGFVPWMYFVIRQIKEAIRLRKHSTTLIPVTVAVMLVAMTLDALTEKYLWSVFIYGHIIGYCSYGIRISQNNSTGYSVNRTAADYSNGYNTGSKGTVRENRL